MRTALTWLFAVAVLSGTPVGAQQKDAELDRLVQQYQSAWNSGDAKAIASLYAERAVRIGEGAPLYGRAAIQAMFEKSFAGEWKGTKVTINTERSESFGADVRVQHGTFELSGGAKGPQKGRYMNTIVREGGQWRIASLFAIPQMPAR